MDKAARVVRRSSVKLMALGGGHTDLHVLLSEVKDMRQSAKAFMNAQNAVSQDLLKWAANEENRALQDVANQLAELNLVWTEVQREFGEHLKDYRHMFEMILEGEKHVSQSRTHFAACEQREVKVRKELKKAFKKSSSAEIQSLEGRLAQSERAKHLAQIEVTDRIRENEAVKLIRLKGGLTKLSQAYSDFARKCTVVFDAQQDIVQELPDVLDQDLEDLKYTGTGVTRHCVQQAKEKVRNYRARKEFGRIPPKYCEPPPPYSLTNDFEPVSPSILYPPCSSPRRRISTAVDNVELKHLQQQQFYYDDCDVDDGDNVPHQQPTPTTASTTTTTPTPQVYDPLYPSLSYKPCGSKTAPSSSVTSPVSTEFKKVPLPTSLAPSSEPCLPSHHHHHLLHHSYLPDSAPPSYKVAQPPPSTFPPPTHMEAAVPEVPADLRPVISKPEYDDDDDVINGGGGCSNSGHIQEENICCPRETVIGLVDFDPSWDDSYEEDLSGAMGGAKI